MRFKLLSVLLVCAAPVWAAPPKSAPKSTAKTAATKPHQHSKTIKHLEDILGRKLSDAEKKKVRAVRDAYDRDLAGALGLTTAQMEAKDKAYKATHKDESKDAKR